jgi:N-acetyl-gamma-glutamylphosphate reductase
VFIDGEAGTTGLQVRERLGSRDDLEVLSIDDDKRKDEAERKRLINEADAVILCTFRYRFFPRGRRDRWGLARAAADAAALINSAKVSFCYHTFGVSDVSSLDISLVSVLISC